MTDIEHGRYQIYDEHKENLKRIKYSESIDNFKQKKTIFFN